MPNGRKTRSIPLVAYRDNFAYTGALPETGLWIFSSLRMTQ
jgi:hypothetical protein